MSGADAYEPFGPKEIARGFVSVWGIALMAAAENYAYFLEHGTRAPGMTAVGSEEKLLDLTEDFLDEVEKWREALGADEARECLLVGRRTVEGLSEAAVSRIDEALAG